MTSLNPVMTVGHQITEALHSHFELSDRKADERATELLDRVGIAHPRGRMNAYPHQLSGGMRQRVMIAIALACEPKILIADEPTTALDVSIQAQILALLRELTEERGTALILITHDLGVVATMCDRVHVMYAGMFVEKAPVGELFARPSHPYTVGLLESLPRMDRDVDLPLQPILGYPPDLLEPPVSCPFRPRCKFEVERSRNEIPKLAELTPGHSVACFNPRLQESRMSGPAAA